MIRSKYLLNRKIGLDRMLENNRKALEDESKEKHRKLIQSIRDNLMKNLKKGE